MPQQTTETPVATFRARIAKLQEAMKEFGLQAVVLEPGPANGLPHGSPVGQK